jgi:hypothetical protein
MKLAYLLALPMLFASTYITTAQAEDVVIREHHGGRHEYRVRVIRRGDRYFGVYNNREYVLRGDAVAHIDREGDYVVYGDIAPDHTYIETSELRPITEERREVIVERERPVIIERREPFIKVGPLEIGH